MEEEGLEEAGVGLAEEEAGPAEVAEVGLAAAEAGLEQDGFPCRDREEPQGLCLDLEAGA